MWQIAEGSQPQIILGHQQKRGGERSLLFVYNSSDGKNTARRNANRSHRRRKKIPLLGIYKSDLKTAATLRWEIADAQTEKVLAVSGAVAETLIGRVFQPIFNRRSDRSIVVRLAAPIVNRRVRFRQNLVARFRACRREINVKIVRIHR
jgi:hypothetical protein